MADTNFSIHLTRVNRSLNLSTMAGEAESFENLKFCERLSLIASSWKVEEDGFETAAIYSEVALVSGRELRLGEAR